MSNFAMNRVPGYRSVAQRTPRPVPLWWAWETPRRYVGLLVFHEQIEIVRVVENMTDPITTGRRTTFRKEIL